MQYLGRWPARRHSYIRPDLRPVPARPSPHPVPVRHPLQTLATPWALRAIIGLTLAVAAVAAVVTLVDRDDAVVSGQADSGPAVAGKDRPQVVSRGSRRSGSGGGGGLAPAPAAGHLPAALPGALQVAHARERDEDGRARSGSGPPRVRGGGRDRALRPAPRHRRARSYAGLGQAAASVAHGPRLDAGRAPVLPRALRKNRRGPVPRPDRVVGRGERAARRRRLAAAQPVAAGAGRGTTWPTRFAGRTRPIPVPGCT